MKFARFVKRILSIIACFFFCSTFALYASSYSNTLVGNSKGLYILSEFSKLHAWKESSVEKIVHSNGWFFLTGNGIVYSSDLSSFEYRNSGLPINIIKHFNGENIRFTNETELLKDLEVHPANSNIMVTLTRDQVYITYDAGLHWQKIGFSARSNGAKAVAVCDMPNNDGSTELTVFVSHSIYGLSYKQPKKSNSWHDIIKGLDNMQTNSYPDEISDILTTASGDVYVAQTFLPRLYKINLPTDSATLLVKGKQPQDTWDGLTIVNDNILFTSPTGLNLYNTHTKRISNTLDKNIISGFLRVKNMETIPHCAWLPASITRTEGGISLCELWLTRPNEIDSKYSDIIANRHSIFVPPTQVIDQAGIDRYIDLIHTNGLDSIVINMKDDYGLLRYKSNDPNIVEKAFISSYSVDLDTFIPVFKKHDVYLIARVVVFKDRNLWRYQNGKYAVKDSSTGNRWQGLRGYKEIEINPPSKLSEQANLEQLLAEQKHQTKKALAAAGFEAGSEDAIIKTPEPVTKKVPDLYDEHWVDPYSQDVWEYNIAVAKELIDRGFDEIQFDYIRFPTDGTNLYTAQYDWQDKNMTKEDALISFLNYARENITAPIGIDIYGANGWYRTGARTGQDAEILAHYVDVICPMFYPSHFEQGFLAYEPAVERPYRIYYYGTYRNSIITRNKALIRPWVQAFYLNCSYDRKYYDDNGDYVRRQMFGTRDSVNNGYMFWNNSGRYTDLTPVPAFNELYPWPSYEASEKFRKPTLSSK
ncbi:MAG TPA: putative glycoside hydrolase [Treponemataceae bacterium]|nr:putative glycoside hydrolase [Treponemataceae bacterium]